MSQELQDLFVARGALLEGHFQLSSGRHSSRYLQCARVLMDPVVASRLGRELADALRSVLGPQPPAAVVAPALGGVLVGHEVARGLGCRSLFTERQDGRMTLRRGFVLEPDEPVVVVEDVITTGGSTREVLEVVQGAGARSLAVGCLVDRSAGALDLGLPIRCLLRVDVPTWSPEACPLCAGGSRPVKPGSRPGA